MRPHHWLGILFFLLLLALIPPLVLADGVAVSTERQSAPSSPADAAEPILFKMAPGETTATFALYLHNTTTATLDNLALFAYLENKQGQTLPEVGLKFLKPADALPLESLSLPANGQSQVLLQVENLTAFGTFTGTITLQHTRTFTPTGAEAATTETTNQVLTEFRLDKPAQPKIVIQGADDNGNISRTTSTPGADLHLELTEESGQVGVDDLMVSLSNAPERSDGGDGPAATVTWSTEEKTT